MSDYRSENVETLTGSSPPTGQAPVFSPLAEATPQRSGDQLIAYAASMTKLRAEEGRLGKMPGDIDGERQKRLDLVWRRRKVLGTNMAGLEAQTAEGLAAKASAICDLDDAELKQFHDLINSMADDAMRLGLSEAPSATPVDVPLAAAWAEYRRLLPIVDGACNESIKLAEVFATLKPKKSNETEDEWQAACQVIADKIGLTQANDITTKGDDELHEIGDFIRDAEARSIRGIGIKADWLTSQNPIDDGDLMTVLRQVSEFAERCSSTAVTGVLPTPTPDAKLAAIVERWVVLGLQLEEAKRVEADQNSEIRALREEFYALRIEIADYPVTSLRTLMLKALLFNGGSTLRERCREDKEKGVRSTTDTLARSIALDLVDLVELLPQEWPFIGSHQPTRVDRRALEAYRTWLSNEFRSLSFEMYPDNPEMMGVRAVNNAGDLYHHRGEPAASTRAERMLTILGLDWTADEALSFGFSDPRHEAAA